MSTAAEGSIGTEKASLKRRRAAPLRLPYPLVRVLWDDAHMSMDEYTPEEVFRDMHRPEQVYTYGLLVQDDECGVTIAMEQGVTDGKFRHLTFIPRGMVVETRRIV